MPGTRGSSAVIELEGGWAARALKRELAPELQVSQRRKTEMPACSLGAEGGQEGERLKGMRMTGHPGHPRQRVSQRERCVSAPDAPSASLPASAAQLGKPHRTCSMILRAAVCPGPVRDPRAQSPTCCVGRRLRDNKLRCHAMLFGVPRKAPVPGGWGIGDVPLLSSDLRACLPGAVTRACGLQASAFYSALLCWTPTGLCTPRWCMLTGPLCALKGYCFQQYCGRIQRESSEAPSRLLNTQLKKC
ncbi:unnamed protein product [Lepidochelys kempii]